MRTHIAQNFYERSRLDCIDIDSATIMKYEIRLHLPQSNTHTYTLHKESDFTIKNTI